jgi:hypothetical protein
MAYIKADILSDIHTVTVQIIQRKNGLFLVEWHSEKTIQRAWVDSEMMIQDKGRVGEVYMPHAGIPYGVDWTVLWSPTVSAIDLDRSLKQRGIWTIEDLRTKPNEGLNAIRDAYGLDLAALLQAAKNHERNSEV